MIEIFGVIKPPAAVEKWIQTGYSGAGGAGAVFGLIPFLNALVKLLIVVAGLYAFFNIIFAGYAFLSAGDDPKKFENAWAKIWQSLLGLIFVAGSFILAAIFGYIIFGKFDAILNPTITSPNP